MMGGGERNTREKSRNAEANANFPDFMVNLSCCRREIPTLGGRRRRIFGPLQGEFARKSREDSRKETPAGGCGERRSRPHLLTSSPLQHLDAEISAGNGPP